MCIYIYICSLLWVMQDLDHQPYLGLKALGSSIQGVAFLGFTALGL